MRGICGDCLKRDKKSMWPFIRLPRDRRIILYYSSRNNSYLINISYFHWRRWCVMI
jgi:hypothetical protein